MYLCLLINNKGRTHFKPCSTLFAYNYKENASYNPYVINFIDMQYCKRHRMSGLFSLLPEKCRDHSSF